MGPAILVAALAGALTLGVSKIAHGVNSVSHKIGHVFHHPKTKAEQTTGYISVIAPIGEPLTADPCDYGHDEPGCDKR